MNKKKSYCKPEIKVVQLYEPDSILADSDVHFGTSAIPDFAKSSVDWDSWSESEEEESDW